MTRFAAARRPTSRRPRPPMLYGPVAPHVRAPARAGQAHARPNVALLTPRRRAASDDRVERRLLCRPRRRRLVRLMLLVPALIRQPSSLLALAKLLDDLPLLGRFQQGRLSHVHLELRL